MTAADTGPGIVDAHHHVHVWDLSVRGQDRIDGRLRFDTDRPVCRFTTTFAEVIAVAHELTAGLGPAERHDVFTGTAARTYDLSVTARPAPPQETPCA
ncbi:amidohydrolase family protein [Streptomyces coeruleorubidus]|uniref:amidohydrolase family protein n=1 Tax=Streptomyces coeruleorubidus TaxID=116188 RepID=UPI00381F6B18